MIGYVCVLSVMALCGGAAEQECVYPGATWETRAPEAVGLNSAMLDAMAAYFGGRGCVVRHGYMVYSWGDVAERGDVASALKPWITHFLFKAVETGRLADVDIEVNAFEPRLNDINEKLDYKDRKITFRHMATQTSCYGVSEAPGTAFDYNDWQMALFWDTLFGKVYEVPLEDVDEKVLHPLLTDLLQCEDNPTFWAFGPGDRGGRLGVSPRDFARFGLLYLREGNWKGQQVLSKEHARMAVTSPLPNSIPRTTAQPAEMIPGQRTLGSQKIPDNQTDHSGSYSWLWWINGVDRNGVRMWPDAPVDTFAALGHAHGMRGMAVFPSLDIVMSWNDTVIGDMPEESGPLNHAFGLIREAAQNAPFADQVIVDPMNPAWLAYNRDANGDGRLDPLFLCGPKGLGDFLYRGLAGEDGVRQGDQAAIIEKMKKTGANGFYVQCIRSHGGAGYASNNPFVDSDPAKGISEKIIAQWEQWFAALDEPGIAEPQLGRTSGIVIVFTFYGGGARVWDTGDTVGAAEQVFIQGIVERFAHHKHLIWCVAEQYERAYSAERIKNLAAVIRAADEHNHVIAVHKANALDFGVFADDPNVDMFALQFLELTADGVHAGSAQASRDARARYGLVLSDALNYGFGPEARKKNWACAMGGAYVMAPGWNFDLEEAPSLSDLEGCGHLAEFFELTDFTQLAPHPELRHVATEYVLAAPGRSYIAYSSNAQRPLGIKDMPAGTHKFLWFDTVTGDTLRQEKTSAESGNQAWSPPFGFGNEVAVWIQTGEH